MQPVEDVGYFGKAYESGFAGVPFYVTATVYDARTPNNFYSSLKNWSVDRLKVLLGLWVKNPETGATMSWTNIPGLREQIAPDLQKALAEAEDATVDYVRPKLLELSNGWDKLRRYIHAFKHGGLVINREHGQLIDEAGEPIDASINVWLTRQDAATGHGDTTSAADDVAGYALRIGHLAIAFAHYFVEARLAPLEAIEFDDQGDVAKASGPLRPPRFWVPGPKLSLGTRHTLHKAFGIEFAE
jgi:hypothetical protein